MNLLSKIYNKDPISKLCKEIKASGLPVVLYGAGMVGKRIYDFLTENNIDIDAVAVDKKYLLEDGGG